MGFTFHPQRLEVVAPKGKYHPGQWMVLEDSQPSAQGDTQGFVAELAQLVQASFAGLICDFERPPTAQSMGLIGWISKYFQARQIPLMVPIPFASQAPYGYLLAQTAIGGGDFAAQCKALLAEYKQLIILEIAPISAEYAMGNPLPLGQLTTEQRRARQATGGIAFFSKELGCNCFFREHKQDSAVFYDTKDSLEYRMKLAKKMGIHGFIGLYQELYPHLSP